MWDVVVLILTVSNALDRPYRERIDVMKRLKHDGTLWVVVRLHSDRAFLHTDGHLTSSSYFVSLFSNR